MIAPAFRRPLTMIVTLLSGALMAAMPVHARSAPQARLVHCGPDTCLRISGHRPNPVGAIRIGGQQLAAQGGRKWQVTVPLAVARGWGIPSGDALTLALVDPRDKVGHIETVALPPGALGRTVELASLVVRAR